MIAMTPQARALVAFSLATLVLTGHLNRLAFAAYAAAGQSLPQSDGGKLGLSLLTVVVAGGVLWFAHMAAGAAGEGWETTLSQAARLLALVGLLIAVLSTIGVLTSSDGTFYGTFSVG
ncbi:hypothetical protein ACVW00_003809 [Marmoricola sp. URHA0025 HA25]